MNEMFTILGLSFIIVLLNLANRKQNRTKTEHMLYCDAGDFNGQYHNIDDWRKIALDLSKSVKNSKLNAMIKYGTDEDVIGLLYLNFGIELYDEIN